MSTSDDKRREVAKKMREYNVAEFKESTIVPFLECLGLGYTGWRGILDELADLIDPTCEDMADVNPVDGFVCSACGWPGVVQQAVDNGWQEYEFDEFAEYVPRYCPHCGARVVRGDD
nr:MAG TPA: zinc-ribbon family protein [Caudoviricetes sp.]